MKNFDPTIITDSDWDKLGFGEKLLLRGSVWLDDQEDRLTENARIAEIAGVEYKPGIYDQFIGFVVDVAQDFRV